MAESATNSNTTMLPYLSLRLLLTLIGITAVVMLVFVGLRFYRSDHLSAENLRQSGDEIATRVAKNVTPTIWSIQQKGVDRKFSEEIVRAVVDAELLSPDVTAIQVYGTFGHRFMAMVRLPDGAIESFDEARHQQIITTAFASIRKPVYHRNVTIGTVEVVLNNQRYRQQLLSNLFLELMQIGVVTGLIVTFIFAALHHSLVKPLQQIQAAKSALQTMDEGVMVLGHDGTLLEANAKMCEMVGIQVEQAVGKSFDLTNFIVADNIGVDSLLNEVRLHHRWSGEIIAKSTTSISFPGWLECSVIHNKKDELIAYVLVIRDMTTVIEQRQSLERLAFHDPLTGLPNRANFERQLTIGLSLAQRTSQRLALFFIDLDNFKTINDTLGHQAGDRLLVEVTKRFQDRLRDSDTLARLGGDEFTVIVPLIRDEADYQVLAKDLIEIAAAPVRIDDRQVYAGASVGIAIFPDDGTTVTDLLKHADMAMYRAKELGRNRASFFSPEMEAKSEARVTMESALRKAISDNEFELHYQPKVALTSGQTIGFEALIRWRNADGRLIPPLDFIPLAEERGLIIPIGFWVLNESIRQATAWRNSVMGGLPIAINLSPVQFYDKSFLPLLRAKLETEPELAKLLEIEVTESMLIKDIDHSIQILAEFKSLGIRIAIDDFGTGYSSLSYLKRLPIDCLKIDRSFIMELETSVNDQSITRAVVALAQSLSLDVVVEGIERQSQADYLINMGCEVGQGYHYSKPLPAQNIQYFLSGASGAVA